MSGMSVGVLILWTIAVTGWTGFQVTGGTGGRHVHGGGGGGGGGVGGRLRGCMAAAVAGTGGCIGQVWRQ